MSAWRDLAARRGRVLITAMVLIVGCLAALSIHNDPLRDKADPLLDPGDVYYDVATPYPAAEIKEISEQCLAFGTTANVDPQKYCQCKLQYIESHATLEQYRAAAAKARATAGQFAPDEYSNAAMSACLGRVISRPETVGS